MKVTSIEAIQKRVSETLHEIYHDTIENFVSINCDKFSVERITCLDNCTVFMGDYMVNYKPLIIEYGDSEINFYRYEENTKEYKWLGWLEYANFKNFTCFMIEVTRRISFFEPKIF